MNIKELLLHQPFFGGEVRGRFTGVLCRTPFPGSCFMLYLVHIKITFWTCFLHYSESCGEHILPDPLTPSPRLRPPNLPPRSASPGLAVKKTCRQYMRYLTVFPMIFSNVGRRRTTTMRVRLAEISERKQATTGGTSHCVCAATEIH